MSDSQAAPPQSSNGQVATTSNQGDGAVSEPKESSAPATQARQPSKMEYFVSITKSLIIRCLIVYFIMSFFKKPQAPPPTDPSGKVVQPETAHNLFPNGTVMSLYVYLTELEEMTDHNVSSLFWVKDGIVYGDWTSGPNYDGIFSVEKDVHVTDNLRNNGSLWLHAYLTKIGQSPNPKAPNYAKNQQSHMKKQLNRYKKLKASGTKNLLTGATDKEAVEDGKIISHWHENFTINLVTDQTTWVYGQVPAPLDQYVKFTENGRFYKPILYGNDFWNMARDYKPLNETLRLRITFQPLTLFKWQLYAAQSMRQWGISETDHSDDEQDTLKETLLDTNPYLLGITIAVSILHSVFELLAFKNDIQFWNNRSSLEGLSVRSVFFGVFQSLVVLLYVLDNEINTLVRISCFVGLCIEFWKIWKVVDIKWEDGRLRFKDKGSYVESSTRHYDNLAFKYLSWLCFPLLVCYSMYALLYLEHKGWYSFVLDLLYGFLLTFGFIMMTPQLFINYKLKSVAHLPWRMLTYKFLNTFIDDMFAFVIKMPIMYRLGCFRDDIVFLVFLYQRWIYPVDKSRRNEFGYAAEPDKAIEGAAVENESNDEDNKTKAIESSQAVEDEALEDEAVEDEAMEGEAVEDEDVEDEDVEDEAVEDEAVEDQADSVEVEENIEPKKTK